MEIGILYSDFSQVWKPFDEVEDFRRDGVLAIAITSERGNRKASCARMWSWQNNDIVAAHGKTWWGEDNYVIGIMPDERFFTTQWAEEDEFLYARSTVDGTRKDRIALPPVFPCDAKVIAFRGEYLPPPEWEKALAIYKDMY